MKLPIILTGNNFKYEIEAVAKLFIPAERLDFTHTKADINSLDEYISAETDNLNLKVSVKYMGQYEELSYTAESPEQCEHELCRLLFHSLKKITGINPP